MELRRRFSGRNPIAETVNEIMKFEITRAARAALCRQAPEFVDVVHRIELHSIECCGDLFYALAQSIVSQQLAVRAADAIFRRLEQLAGGITPARLLAAEFDMLRGCGLSGRKIEYLRGIAEAALSGAVDFEKLAEKTDGEVIAELTKLRGVGVWTAEMLLIFALGRPDVLSFNDLGIRRGIMQLNRLDSLDEARFEYYRKRYSPYGTLASLYLWRIKDGGLRPDGDGQTLRR